jgi:hypothetical protein
MVTRTSPNALDSAVGSENPKVLISPDRYSVVTGAERRFAATNALELVRNSRREARGEPPQTSLSSPPEKEPWSRSSLAVVYS